MGVHGLKKLLQKYAPTVLQPAKPLSAYRSCRFVIDAAGMMHRYKHAIYNEKEPYAYLSTILNQYEQLVSHGIHCTYVFDGKKPLCKQNEMEKRHAKKQRDHVVYQEKVAAVEAARQLAAALQQTDQDSAVWMVTNNGGNTTALLSALELQQLAENPADVISALADTAERHQKRIASVTADDIAALQSLFTFHGVPFMVATGEGEKACAWMTRVGLADIVIADDTDTLAYGATRVLMHLMSSKYPPIEVSLEAVLSGLKLDLTHFVDMCIMCGCDFAKVPGIAWGRAYDTIRQNGSFDDIIRKFGSVDAWLQRNAGRQKKSNKKTSKAPVPVSIIQKSSTDASSSTSTTATSDVLSPLPRQSTPVDDMVREARREFTVDAVGNVYIDQRPFHMTPL